MKKIYFVALSFAFASCSDNIINDEIPVHDEDVKEEINEEEDKNPSRSIILSESDRTLAENQLEFACNLYKASAAGCEIGNFIISPLSAYIDLSMVLNGASGNTASELMSVLMKNASSIDSLNKFNEYLCSELITLDNTTELRIANSIWSNQSFEIEQSFIDVNENFYHAPSTSLDFSKSESFDLMNKWLDEATNGRIKEFQVERTPKLKLVIANALYFNSRWASPFDPKDTKDAEFINSDGSKSTVKMMHGERYNYVLPITKDNNKFAIVEIPYGNSSFSFYVTFSVDENDSSLSGIENVVNASTIKNLDWYMRHGIGFIELPKFNVSTDGDICESLEEMGIVELFRTPNLLNISKSAVGDVRIIQESNLTVEETGAEGAATTYLMISSSPSPNSPQAKPVSFTVDRPFVFWIMEKSVGSILFMGRVDKL